MPGKTHIGSLELLTSTRLLPGSSFQNMCLLKGVLQVKNIVDSVITYFYYCSSLCSFLVLEGINFTTGHNCIFAGDNQKQIEVIVSQFVRAAGGAPKRLKVSMRIECGISFLKITLLGPASWMFNQGRVGRLEPMAIRLYYGNWGWSSYHGPILSWLNIQEHHISVLWDDSPFCSTTVLFNHCPFSLNFWRFSRKDS